MTIGFDAKRAFANYTGLGNYSRYVIHSLSTYFPNHQYRLYAPKDTGSAAMKILREQPNITMAFPQGLYTSFSSIWRTKGIPADLLRDKVQLYHGLSNELPIGLKKKGIRSVVTIHDLIFLRYPQFYQPIDRAIYTRKFRYACREADHIIAVSECTKRDIVSYFDIEPDKISVIYQGCDTSFSKKLSFEEKQQVITRYHLPDTFMLNVGTIEARKNLLLAVKALSQMDDSVHLVAVGRQTKYTEEVKTYIAAHGLEQRVHFLSGIPLSDLPALYQLASVFVYPSIFEGFGIPIIEALHSGTPVIAATGSCLEEAGGPHSTYVAPNNDKQLADAASQVISDVKTQAEMIAAGKNYVTRFDDQLLAQQMMTLYQQVIQ